MRTHDRITRGALINLDLAEIVQLLSVGCKTAAVTLKTGQEHGCIWFEEGHAVHAQTRRALGEPAFTEMMGWRSGTFEIEHGSTTDGRTIHQDTTFLVLEALRLRDEDKQYAAELEADQRRNSSVSHGRRRGFPGRIGWLSTRRS